MAVATAAGHNAIMRGRRRTGNQQESAEMGPMRTEDRFLRLMQSAIRETDGSEAEAYAAFKDIILNHHAPELVWDLFAPVRVLMLRKLFEMAKYRLEHDDTPPPERPSTAPLADIAPAPEPDEKAEPDDEADADEPVRGNLVDLKMPPPGELPPMPPIEPPPKTVSVAGHMRSQRGTASAQAALMRLGRRNSPWRWMVNTDGVPVRHLTPVAFQKFCEQGPVFAKFGRLVMQRCPPSDRPQDTVGLFVDEAEAAQLWEEALLRVRIVA
jgi:hypothetical protein